MMLPPLPSEQQPWPGVSDVVCAILCGGKGSRLFPRTLTTQKSLLEIAGQPILWHVLRFWSQFSHRFVFVVKH
ncbi:NTP transferase domain-containing protein, partial [bacterium]|nr:NTP transferase domain-containing protein [bacterium]